VDSLRRDLAPANLAEQATASHERCCIREA
jgi:hypothetical protein